MGAQFTSKSPRAPFSRDKANGQVAVDEYVDLPVPKRACRQFPACENGLSAFVEVSPTVEIHWTLESSNSQALSAPRVLPEERISRW